MNPPSEPFISIGVTTYDRRELLKEALGAILGQSFQNFEVMPLIHYRFHADCGATGVPLQQLRHAGEALVSRSAEMFSISQLRPDFLPNMAAIFHLCLDHYYNKVQAG